MEIQTTLDRDMLRLGRIRITPSLGVATLAWTDLLMNNIFLG